MKSLLYSLTLHGAVILAVIKCYAPKVIVVADPIYFESIEVEECSVETKKIEKIKVEKKESLIEPIVEDDADEDIVEDIDESEIVKEVEIDDNWEEAPIEELLEAPKIFEHHEANEMANVISPPYAINRISPRYPRSARQRGYEGKVVIVADISAVGEVKSIKLKMSSGHKMLDNAALKAVSEAKFAPAISAGVAIEGEISLTFEFRLTTNCQ